MFTSRVYQLLVRFNGKLSGVKSSEGKLVCCAKTKASYYPLFTTPT